MTPPPPSFSASQVFAFTDAEQRGWEVRAIRDPLLPAHRARYLHPAYAGGWLLFTCGDERRRYAPLPAEWDSAGEAQLREWCLGAIQVSTLRLPLEPRP